MERRGSHPKSAHDWSKPTLRGERVTLRPYRDDDFDALWEMVHEPEGTRLTASEASFTELQIRDWIARIQTADERIDLVVEENATSLYAGEVVLNQLDPDGLCMNFRIALRGPPWFGRGLGTEATALICEYAFGALGLVRITLDVLAENPRARRVYEKCGFSVAREYSEDGRRWVHMVREASLAETSGDS